MNDFEKIIENNKDFKKFYKIKKKIFPIKKIIDIFPEKGNLIDLGCGNGIFPAMLSLKHKELKIIGVDDDKTKIDLAKKTFSQLKNLSFIKENILNFELKEADIYSLIDVLYLIPFELQIKLIDGIYKKLEINGKLIIKEMDKTPFYKYLFNIFQESISVKIIHRTMGSKFYFIDSFEYIKIFKKIGFDVQYLRADKGYLYPHVVYILTKS
jgi:ubiquinone/menaquinone biosynthesis C-methylase UbiE